MAEAAGSSLLNIRNSFSGSTISGPSIRGEDIVNKKEFVEQSKKFAETQQKDTQSLSTIQEQFNNLQTQINTLAAGLTKVQSLIQQDTVSEQTLLKKEQSEENKYSQKKIRAGNENQLEQKIQSALVAPVQQAAAKVENIFGRIGQALTGLFLGWLGVQGVKALKASADKDYDALTNIKNNIVKNIGLGIAGIAAIKLGFGIITRAIMGVVAKVGSIIANVIKLPFKAVGAAAAGLGSMLRGGPKPSGAGASPSGSPSAKPAAPVPKPNIIQRATGAAKGALKNLGGPLIQATAGTAIDIAMGEEPGRASAGAAGGVTAAAAGSKIGGIFGLPGRLLGGILGYGFGSGLGKDGYNKATGQSPPAPAQTAKPSEPKSPIIPTTTKPGENKSPAAVTTTQQKEVQKSPELAPAPKGNSSSPFTGEVPEGTKKDNAAPQTSMMPAASDLTLNVNIDKSEKEQKYWKSEADYWNTIASGLKAGSSYEELGLNQDEIDYLEGNSDKPPFMMNRKIPEMETKPTELTNKTIQTKPITAPSIPPLEQPSPNVMVASAPAPQQQKTAIPSSTGTDVPFIPSANPNNFYVMYSKLNYNVVA